MTEADVSEPFHGHIREIREAVEGSSISSTDKWTDPAGKDAYLDTSENGVLIDTREPRPSVPADQRSTHSTGGAFNVVTIARAWIKAPWSGWHETATVSAPRRVSVNRN